MKLITLVQVSNSGDEEEGIIAKLLMVSSLTDPSPQSRVSYQLNMQQISYLISPVLSFAVVGSLRAAQAAV